jgi:hypothetical protein
LLFWFLDTTDASNFLLVAIFSFSIACFINSSFSEPVFVAASFLCSKAVLFNLSASLINTSALFVAGFTVVFFF